MKGHKQTRTIKVNVREKFYVRGNPLATIIACFMDLDSPEDAFQVQDYYDKGEAIWATLLSFWLEERGWDWGVLDDHLYTGEFYIVYGESYRGTTHACIYQNGALYHDPHPNGKGLAEETHFEYLRPNKVILN